MPKRMTELEKSRQRTQSFLDELGVKMPIIKFSTQVPEANLLKNKAFIKIATEVLFNKIDEELRQSEVVSVREMKLHLAVFKHAYKKKFMYDEWVKTKLSAVINSIYPKIINTLQDIVIVDCIDDDGSKWLDIDYPLYYSCLDEHFPNVHKFSDEELEPIEKAANDFIDYTALLVCKYIYKFVKDLDDTSKEQIMGNIGGLDDIRSAARVTLEGNLLSIEKQTEWYKEFLKHYETCILLGREEFLQKVEELSIINEVINEFKNKNKDKDKK